MTNNTDKNSNTTRSRAEAQSKSELASHDSNQGRKLQARHATCGVYEQITQRVISLLTSGTIPWRKPWNVQTGLPRNLISKKPYRGINAFLLHAMSYESPYWLTFHQAAQLGGTIRKGEKACPVVFWKQMTVDEEEPGEQRRIPLLRYYHVFNLAQCEGLKQTPDLSPAHLCSAQPASIIEQMPNRPTIRHGMSRAFYQPVEDFVGMPNSQRFEKEAEYFATLFHEVIHSTGHPSRLNRQTLTLKAGFGSGPYCKEELIAEMGAAFLCAHAGIVDRTIENSAAYLKGWLEQFRNDHTLIIKAAAQAQKAVDFILGVKQGEGENHE